MIVSEDTCGIISGINGSIIKVKGLEKQVRLHDLLKIVEKNILCEVIQIYSDHVVAQSFEDTTNLKLNDKVANLRVPLSMELGPGLLNNVFDGIQRPLGTIFKNFKEGHLESGIEFSCLRRKKRWHFTPLLTKNTIVNEGNIIGFVEETKQIAHRIMIPPGVSGLLTFIAEEGEYTIIDEIFRIKNELNEHIFSMMQKWPITQTRPFSRRIKPHEPLITGMRYIDLLFPIAKGGTCAIPGGFGTGKSVLLQIIAKFCDADIIVYVCCGEPGNEIASILKQFSETIDPKTGQPLSEHIVVIANTSNMPVSAREASLFSGVTIAEYYRDMGYHVALIADSTSRWAESLREISSRLEEMPAEEGYPAYLFSKLSGFYERAGLVKCLANEKTGKAITGSITIFSSLSPPGGDLNEPVTASTKRVVQELLVLDKELAYLKNYPAISWLNSYSIYSDYITAWWNEKDLGWEEVPYDWMDCRVTFNEILSKERGLEDVRQILGVTNLSEEVKLELFMAKLIRTCILNQNAFDKVDCYTSADKLIMLAKIIKFFYNNAKKYILNNNIDNRLYNVVMNDLIYLAHQVPNENIKEFVSFKDKIKNIFDLELQEWMIDTHKKM